MKNIVRLSILLSSFVCLLLFACDRDEQEQYKGANKGFFPFDTMEVHPLGDEIEVTFVSDVDWMMSYTSNWFNVYVNEKLYKNKKKYEKGSYKIKFDIKPYVEDEGKGDPRKAKIIFRNTSNIRNESDIASFDISQKRAYIEVSGVTFDEEGKGEIDFDWYEKNDSNSFQVESSVEYEISIGGDDPDKINVYHGESLANSVYYGGAAKNAVIAPVDYNFSKKENTAIITITPIRFDVDGNRVEISEEEEKEKVLKSLKKTIAVSQDNLIFAIIETDDVQEAENKLNRDNNIAIPTALSGFSELGYNYLEVSGDQQSASKSIVVALQDETIFNLEGVNNEEVKFNFIDCEDGEIDEIPVKYTRYDVCVLKPNPENEEHEIPVTISLTDNKNKADIELTLVQNPYIFKLEKIGGTDGNFANKPKGEESKTYKLSTSGPWRLESNNADWLQIGNNDDPTEGQGDHEFTISIKERNMDTQDIKSVELVFVAEFDGGVLHTETLTVAQDKYLFEITDRDGNQLDSQIFTSFDTDERTFKIQSSGEWKIEKVNDAEWLTVSPNYGNGNGDITIQVEENGGKDDRTETIKLISVTHKDKDLDEFREMVITQHHP